MKKQIILTGVVPVRAYFVVDTEMSDEQLAGGLSLYKVQAKLAGRFETQWADAQCDRFSFEVEGEEEEAEYDDVTIKELFVAD